MIVNPFSRKSRRLQGRFEAELEKLVLKFFVGAHRLSFDDIQARYREFESEWRRRCRNLNASNKELTLHEDEFEIRTRFAYPVVYFTKSRARVSMLRTIRAIEGRGQWFAFFRRIVYLFYNPNK